MAKGARWLGRNRFGLLGALLGATLIGLLGAPLTLGGGVIGFAAGHFLDGRGQPPR